MWRVILTDTMEKGYPRTEMRDETSGLSCFLLNDWRPLCSSSYSHPSAPGVDWLISLSSSTRQCGSALRFSEHTPCARPVLLEQLGQRTDQGLERHAKNRRLNPLSAPPPSEQKAPASLVIPGSRWCGQHALFGLGCSRQDRQNCFELLTRPSLLPRSLVSAWHQPRELCIWTFSWHVPPNGVLPAVFFQ